MELNFYLQAALWHNFLYLFGSLFRMLLINGAEGGGQILRTSLALSVLTKTAFHMEDIRKNRPKPGLKPQHLAAIAASQKLSSAQVEGANPGSLGITFIPKELRGGNISIDIGTAGSITLLLQAVLIPSLFGKRTRFRIQGGTDVPFSMPVDYFNQVFAPHLRTYGDISVSGIRRGYMPKGGGWVELRTKPFFRLDEHPSFSSFHQKQFTRGLFLTEQQKLFAIQGISHASKDLEKAEVAERQATAAKHALRGFPVSIAAEYCDTLSTGSGITLWAVYSSNPEAPSLGSPIRLGADCLGEKGRKAEAVGEEAAKALLREMSSGAPVDSHLADNLIPLLGIFGGSIRVSQITPHTLSNIETVKKFLNTDFKIQDKIITAASPASSQS